MNKFIPILLNKIARQIQMAEFLMDWQQLEFLMNLYDQLVKIEGQYSNDNE